MIKTQSIWLGVGMAVGAIATSLIETLSPFPQGLLGQTPIGFDRSQSNQDCISLVAALNPPLNVRSQPFVAPNNIIGKLETGMQISIEKTEGNWLLLNAPLQGWVYQKSTATSCSESRQILAAIPPASSSNAPIDSGSGVLAIAIEQYHLGNIDAAIALVKSIPGDSAVSEEAKIALIQWPENWQKAQDQFYAAQSAIREGRWQEVLDRVESYPDIRFWREKLTPVVREAIKQQQRANRGSSIQAQQSEASSLP